MNDWRANITHDVLTQVATVAVYRRSGDRVEYVACDGTIRTCEPNAGVPPSELLHVPADALAAIGEAIRPGPSHAQLECLLEALSIERLRVDRIITKAVS